MNNALNDVLNFIDDSFNNDDNIKFWICSSAPNGIQIKDKVLNDT